MSKRFAAIWFRYLQTDWFTRRQPALAGSAFVVASPHHGRMVITAANAMAELNGITPGMVVADARAIVPSLKVIDEKPGLAHKLLNRIAEWCIRFTPFVAVDLPDGLIFDATGCSHLWGGDNAYLTDILNRLSAYGYHARAAISDTIGASWAVSRFGKGSSVIDPGLHTEALLALPPAALRLEGDIVERLQKLGLRQIKDLLRIPRSAIRKRFGVQFIQKLNQALGIEDEIVHPVHPVEPYHERLTSLEPIITAAGIEIALQKLLDTLCHRLQQEEKGLRVACFTGYRIDGKIVRIDISTIRPSNHTVHLYKLFEIKMHLLEPGPGIELFILQASKVEDCIPSQKKLWESACNMQDHRLAELVDRLAGRLGAEHIHRYMPDERYWPERSFRAALSLDEKPHTSWRTDKPRPLQVLQNPEPVEVTAPIPDYPPMLFRHKGKLHKIIKADGPERIEQEWWIQQGEHRDYYCVEDEEGHRYWLFRSGHYDENRPYHWFIHGFFA